MSAPQSVVANFTAIPLVSLTPTSIDFENVYLDNVSFQNVTLKDVGNALLRINGVSLTPGSGSDAGNFRFDNLCPSTLEAGKSCTIVVFFDGKVIGSGSATLKVSDNAPESPQTVSLSGNVINPRGSLTPTSLFFGSVEVHDSKTLEATLTNVGTTALDITKIAISGTNAGDFVKNNECPGSLGPGDHCFISITFTPSATGHRTADLTVTDNTISPTQTVVLNGTGTP